MSLCLKLGIPSPRILAEILYPEEIIAWQAFYMLEPWGCDVDDYRFGKVVAALRGGDPEEVFHRWTPPPDPVTDPEVMMSKIKFFADTVNRRGQG